MRSFLWILVAGWLLLGGPAALVAQDTSAPAVDSVLVQGNQRLTASQIIGTSGLIVHQPINYRDIQRAITALFKTGQFDDVVVEQRNAGPRLILVIRVKERPVLEKWAVRGANRVGEGEVKSRVHLTEGRPLDRNAVEQARAGIDSLYKHQGYYASQVKVLQLTPSPGRARIVFDVQEGQRVAISQVIVDGNKHFSDKAVVKHMATRPEGFWWFQKGEFDERTVEQDVRERLPNWYADQGFVDFQVTHDSLVSDSTGGKAVLRLTVDEGPVYRVGTFDIQGNRRFSIEELRALYPFGPVGTDGAPLVGSRPFSRSEWNEATDKVQKLYANNGYIYAQVQPEEIRRTATRGAPVVDLRWTIREGSPATINKVEIVGNDVTHERVIREAIVMLPGDLFSQDRLIRSYQNVANLGFFQQPMPPPDVRPAANGVDVDVVFRVEERRTGNINFGASLGQGTGVGGFLGLEEPNLFGRGKRGKLQWQFGKNINDFTLSYTDPAIRESRVSGTLSVFDSRARYNIGDLGRRKQTGASLQLGFPLLGSRYTRLFPSYSYQLINYSEGSADIQARFQCSSCTKSTLGLSVVRDTRVGLPFATGGFMTNVGGEWNGGILGGTGDYRKVDLEGRWYAPLGSLGGGGQLGAGVQFVLGLTAKSGFVFGDAGPFYQDLYALGGVQYGIPLRGYNEFSITPNGFDPSAGGNSAASSQSFGKSYAAFTVEAGARISQSLYVSTFFDAGNVYRSARQWDPTRLFRGAGFGAAVISPLGPIGIDLGYGFDKVNAAGRPTPGWQLHFKLGNFF
ncbi:MAG TPA: outer membrane protein assembly factor BamA [Gemmatimonadales bacterium]|jgi:outer membrane protein insertion porin family|nr:outer membrane protein assembly factor BamA [Gemmatimonadales bacterium]